jgi:hypothetical protein
VTIQAIVSRSGHRYLPLQDDIASVAYWYQAELHGKFPRPPGRGELEVMWSSMRKGKEIWSLLESPPELNDILGFYGAAATNNATR